MPYQLTISGETPSLKNSKQIVQAGRFPKLVPSKAYKKWAKQVLRKLKRCELVGRPWHYPVIIDFHFYRTTRRRFDYVNLCQGPLDLMVEAGILDDDDMTCVIPGQWAWDVDQANPRVEVTIYE